MNFYIADLHFGHEAVIRMDNRPFADVEEMDRRLIANWNARVHWKDHVYVIGDFCFRNRYDPMHYLGQLNGIKHLVVGNHEKAILNNEEARKQFVEIDKMIHVSDCNQHICLCHFPIADWNGMWRGKPHIYGHIHNHVNQIYKFMRMLPNCYNAGCMINNYMPVPLEELIRNNKEFDRQNGLDGSQVIQLK